MLYKECGTVLTALYEPKGAAGIVFPILLLNIR
jgi:hypothetical protein